MELSAATGRGEDPTGVVATHKKALDGEQTTEKSAMFGAGDGGREGDDSFARRHVRPAPYEEARGRAVRPLRPSAQPPDRPLTRDFVAATDAPGHGELPYDMWPTLRKNEMGHDSWMGDRDRSFRKAEAGESSAWDRREEYPDHVGNGKRAASSCQQPTGGGGMCVSSAVNGGGGYRRSRWEAFASSETENMHKGERRHKKDPQVRVGLRQDFDVLRGL